MYMHKTDLARPSLLIESTNSTIGYGNKINVNALKVKSAVSVNLQGNCYSYNPPCWR